MLRDIVCNLLLNLGGRKEVERYLAEYDKGRGCTVVKVGGGLVRDDQGELSSALALLHHVGMRPVVVHGAGPQLTSALAGEDLESTWLDGLRVTTPEVLAVALRVFQRVGAELADGIGARGVPARPLVSGVFRARLADREELGLVGEISEVDGAPVEQALAAGCLPILAPVGTTADGRLLNVNADHAARAMAAWRRSKKVLFLTPTGGILDEKGRVIPAVNCEIDLPDLVDSGRVRGGMARKLKEIRELLGDLDATASVSITAPDKIARELFTYRGSGTLVRLGTPIRHLRGTSALDPERLQELLESSFGRALDPTFLDNLTDADVHLGGDYMAVAVVRRRDGADYLDKIAITAEAQGIGLGAALWKRLRADHPKLYWRSRPENAANKWYLPRSDGMHRTKDWLVFWYGVEGRERIETCIHDALSFPASFGTQRSNTDG